MEITLALTVVGVLEPNLSLLEEVWADRQVTCSTNQFFVSITHM